jgi:uncharacterized alkaline shock family protein YloU
MNWEKLMEQWDQMLSPSYPYLAGAALALFLFFILLRKRQPKKVVAYATENGEVTVSRRAIIELVQTSCQQLNFVSKPQVKIKVKGKYTHFEVRIKLTSGASLRKIEETLQSHLRRALSEDLGIENLGKINITATGFKSGKISELPPKINERIALDEPEYVENDLEDPEGPQDIDPEKVK